MNAHTVKLDMYDQSARLVALDFETRRVIVTWGSGMESWTSGFELRADGWHRFTAAQSWGLQQRALKQGGQALGPCYDDLIFTPVVPIRADEDDPRVELDAFVAWLRDLGVCPSVTSGPARTRAVGAWLLGMRRALMHGFELCELAQEHHASPLDGAALDGVIKPLVKAGVVRPYSFDPSYSGMRCHAFNELDSAKHFPPAIAGEMRHELMNRGEDYSLEEYVELCARLGVVKVPTSKSAPYGGATGSIFWYFTQGKKFADMPRFVI